MANERHTDKDKKKIKEMETFLKAAFCIDGDCAYIENVKVTSSLKTTTSMLFSLCDTKKGVFYVSISK